MPSATNKVKLASVRADLEAIETNWGKTLSKAIPRAFKPPGRPHVWSYDTLEILNKLAKLTAGDLPRARLYLRTAYRERKRGILPTVPMQKDIKYLVLGDFRRALEAAAAATGGPSEAVNEGGPPVVSDRRRRTRSGAGAAPPNEAGPSGSDEMPRAAGPAIPGQAEQPESSVQQCDPLSSTTAQTNSIEMLDANDPVLRLQHEVMQRQIAWNASKTAVAERKAEEEESKLREAELRLSIAARGR